MTPTLVGQHTIHSAILQSLVFINRAKMKDYMFIMAGESELAKNLFLPHQQ